MTIRADSERQHGIPPDTVGCAACDVHSHAK